MAEGETPPAAPSNTPDPAPAPAPSEPTPAPAPANEPPVEYKFELPDGMTLDDDLIGRFTEQAKTLKLPADAAQAFVSLGAEAVQKQVSSVKAAHEARLAEWSAQAKSDPEVGGPKFDENLAAAGAALAKMAPELKSFLDETGLGNHPAMIRFAFKVGKMLEPDGYVQGSRTNNQQGKVRDHAKTLYPDLN